MRFTLLKFPTLATAASFFFLSFFLHSYLDRRYWTPSFCSMSYMRPEYQLVPPSYIHDWYLTHATSISSSSSSSQSSKHTNSTTLTPPQPHPLSAWLPNFTDAKLKQLHLHYQVYLYRERNLDKPVPNITADPLHFASTSLPVIFLHGNAGSFEQGRSFGGLLAQMYPLAQRAYSIHVMNAEELENKKNPTEKQGQRQGLSLLPFHVYLVDFKEEFSAISPSLLLDQAHYLTTLLHFLRWRYQVVHIPILGHSMGGLVARLAVAFNTYPMYSVQHLMTLSTPHVYPPLPLSNDLNQLYAAVNAFWATSLPHPIAVMSITGGFMDRQVAPFLTSVTPWCPMTTTDSSERRADTSSWCASYSSLTVPTVQATCDHLAIVWCRELLVLISHVLYTSQTSWLSLNLLKKTYPLHFQSPPLDTTPALTPQSPPMSPSWFHRWRVYWTWPLSSPTKWTWTTPWKGMMYRFQLDYVTEASSKEMAFDSTSPMSSSSPSDETKKDPFSKSSKDCVLQYSLGDTQQPQVWGNLSANFPQVIRYFQSPLSQLQFTLIPSSKCKGDQVHVDLRPHYIGFFRWMVGTYFMDLFLVYPWFHTLIYPLGSIFTHYCKRTFSMYILGMCLVYLIVLFLSLPFSSSSSSSSLSLSLLNHLQQQEYLALPLWISSLMISSFIALAFLKITKFFVYGLGLGVYGVHCLWLRMRSSWVSRQK
ncbi:GPI inositol deacylase [Coelomomyces lativittatus]|nr:GPI inositol deacylase [Coelomomyces lativittatus]KAJ1509709.1 GPI inositol deacylase [Coelomomyces lativittatus]